MTDPIADMLTRIRNAYLARHSELELPSSALKRELGLKLQELGYLESVAVKDTKPRKSLVLTLKYVGKTPAVTVIKRLSTPGRRLYLKKSQIRSTLSGHGATVISTSKGLLSDKQAKKEGLGGELICQVW